MKALDCSKYTKTVTPDVVARWQAEGVGLLIIQAHPPNYGQPRSLEIMRAAQAAGMPWDAYIYQYLAYVDWLPGALATLDVAAAEGLVPRKAWLDVEDIDSGQGWLPSQRREAVRRDLDLCDQWLMAHERGLTGIYSAHWYWGTYMGNTTEFSERQLWAAQYDDVPDASVLTPFGGWASCRIKQFAGSQPDGTDLNVLSAEEEAEIVADCTTYKEAIDHGVQRLWLELAKKTTLSKKIVREIAAELYAALQS